MHARLSLPIVFVLLMNGITAAEEIVTPSTNDAWTCPGAFLFFATGCTASPNTYQVVVEYKNNAGNWSQIYSNSFTPNFDDEIEAQLVMNATPDCGRHDGKVTLSKIGLPANASLGARGR